MLHSFRSLLGAVAIGTALLGSAASTQAAGFTSLTVFGDSLSDTGNVFLATGGAVPVAPYFNGRFSNGPVWIDTLAGGLGLPSGAVPSLMGGTNFAFGGARTGANPADFVPGVLAQVAGLWVPSLGAGMADPTGLYVMVGGGNDMRDARSGNPANIGAAATAAANNLVTALGVLASKGAKNVLLANLPDLGQTPEAVGLGLVGVSTQASNAFNASMSTVIGAAQSFGMNVSFLDLAGLGTTIRNDALNNGGAVYGITNVFTPCGPFQGSVGISCDVSQFSDALHPSARAHQILGDAAVAVVPEPGTYLLMLGGIAALLLRLRRSA